MSSVYAIGYALGAQTKQAWEVGTEAGFYTNRSDSYLRDRAQNDKYPYYGASDSPENIQKTREFYKKMINTSLRNNPESVLSWVDIPTVTPRSWYNPMRYIDGKDKMSTRDIDLEYTDTKYHPEKVDDAAELLSSTDTPMTAFHSPLDNLIGYTVNRFSEASPKARAEAAKAVREHLESYYDSYKTGPYAASRVLGSRP